MPRPYTLIESVPTPEGMLELRQRGERDFMLTIRGQVLMTSALRRSEIDLARLGCAPIRERSAARVLIGGLGLGFTLRAALDSLQPDARVVVAELNPIVVRWCRGPLAVLTDNSLASPQVSVVEEDVTKIIRGIAEHRAEPRFDAIIWDLYRGPGGGPASHDQRLYDAPSVSRAHRALSERGVFAVWGERPSPQFEVRMSQCGFRHVQTHTTTKGPRHVVYIALK